MEQPEKITKLLSPLRDSEGNQTGFVFFCPACDIHHVLDKRWTVEGTEEKPTVIGSFLQYDNSLVPRCHLFIKEGQLQYLSDCTHALKDKTVPMVPMEFPTKLKHFPGEQD